MRTIALSTHTLGVRRKMKPGEYEFLGAIDGGGNLYHIVLELLRGLEREHSHNERQQQLMRVTRLDADGESMWGLLEAGEHGYGARLVNVNTKADSYRRIPADAEMVPFYFLLNIPPDTKKGILILQRFGVQGIQTPFARALQDAIAEVFPEYLIDLRAHVPREVLKYLLEGRLKGLSFTEYKRAVEIEDMVLLGGAAEEVVKVKTIYEAPKNRFFQEQRWVKDLLSGRRSFYEVRDELGHPQADHLTVNMDYGGTRRSVDFANPEKITPYINITGEVDVDDDNHPIFEGIHQYASTLLDELKDEIGRLM